MGIIGVGVDDGEFQRGQDISHVAGVSPQIKQSTDAGRQQRIQAVLYGVPERVGGFQRGIVGILWGGHFCVEPQVAEMDDVFIFFRAGADSFNDIAGERRVDFLGNQADDIGLAGFQSARDLVGNIVQFLNGIQNNLFRRFFYFSGFVYDIRDR